MSLTRCRNKTVYAADRHDTWIPVDESATPEALEDLVQRVILVRLTGQALEGTRIVWTHLGEDGKFRDFARDIGVSLPSYVAALRLYRGRPDAVDPLEGAIVWDGHRIHHTGTGDCLLAHRAVWNAVGGHLETWDAQFPPTDSIQVSRAFGSCDLF